MKSILILLKTAATAVADIADEFTKEYDDSNSQNNPAKDNSSLEKSNHTLRNSVISVVSISGGICLYMLSKPITIEEHIEIFKKNMEEFKSYLLSLNNNTEEDKNSIKEYLLYLQEIRELKDMRNICDKIEKFNKMKVSCNISSVLDFRLINNPLQKNIIKHMKQIDNIYTKQIGKSYYQNYQDINLYFRCMQERLRRAIDNS